MLSNALRWIRSLLVSIPGILLATAALGTLALVCLPLDRRGRRRERCRRLWARLIVVASFVRITVRGLEKLDPVRTCVFCANHQSYMDPPIVIAALGRPVRFLAKKSLFSIPFLGWGMRLVGDVPVDRENARAAARSLRRAADLVRGGVSLVVFSEGGRSLDGTLQPFLSGAFRLAIDAGVPVVPLAILGTREVLAPGSIHIRGGSAQVIVGSPIPTEGVSRKDRGALAGQVRQIIRRMLEAGPSASED